MNAMQQAFTKAKFVPRITCPYCDKPAEKVTGKEIYPHRPDLYGKTFYQYEPCDAYVGCHPGTSKPLGRLANAELRAAKSNAHAHFDLLWLSDEMSRSAAYAWLAQQLGISKDECHIGMFDVAMCERAAKVSKDYFND